MSRQSFVYEALIDCNEKCGMIFVIEVENFPMSREKPIFYSKSGGRHQKSYLSTKKQPKTSITYAP
jgi:hypothetical protein